MKKMKKLREKREVVNKVLGMAISLHGLLFCNILVGFVLVCQVSCKVGVGELVVVEEFFTH